MSSLSISRTAELRTRQSRHSERAGPLPPKILDHFGLEHPHYAGPGVGTPLANRFMADNPGRLRSAVVGEAAAIGDVEGDLVFRLSASSKLMRWAVLSGGGPISGRIYSRISNKHGFIRTQHPDKDRLRDYRASTTTFAKLRAQTGFLASYPDEMPVLTRVVGTIEHSGARSPW